MFEQAVLVNPAKRVWSTCAGMTAQALLVLAACLVPIVSPDVLPRAQQLVSLVAPGAPTQREPAEKPRQAQPRAVPTPPSQVRNGALILPFHPPDHAVTIEDPPAAASCPGCLPVTGGGQSGNPIERWIKPTPPEPVRESEKHVTAVQAEPTGPLRLPGGDVRLAHPIYRVEPHYPQMAIAARISGPVELEGIIGTDGRIRDLHALSGNPVLVPAALEAVRQWVYEPTLLNGKPVEVIAPITVIFRLTR